MPHLNSFGGRLRDARQEKKLSGRWMVNYLNGYLAGCGLAEVALTTYYSWEKIGTHAELIKGKSYPHPIVYKLLLIPLGVTGYWLLNGDQGGKIIRRRSELPQLESINYGLEQLSSLKQEDELTIEARRVMQRLSPAQRKAALTMLKSIR